MSLFSSAATALRNTGATLGQDVRTTYNNYKAYRATPGSSPLTYGAMTPTSHAITGTGQYGPPDPNAGGGGASDTTPPIDTGPSWNDINASLLKLQQEINSSRNLAPVAPPTLPKFDIQDIFNRAHDAAASAVSPYYEKTLQNFMDTQQHKRDQATQDLQTTKDIQAQDLANLQQANETQRQRTTQDVATNQGLINTAETAYNTNSAANFVKASDALRGNQANANTLFSGLGQQDQSQQLRDKTTANNQQGAQFNAQRDQQALFKSRTFEDLARSEQLQQQAGNRVVANQTTQNEHTFQDMADELVQKQRDLEMQKQDAISQGEGAQAKGLFSNFLSTLRTPQQVAYANDVYAPLF